VAVTQTFSLGQRVQDRELYLSALTLGEIRKGIERLRDLDARRVEVFAAWLAELRGRFADRILSVDVRVSEECGGSTPARIAIPWSLFAATARVNGLTVVTRSTADFAGCDVPLLNLWHEQPSSPS
jgi:toxin FitB